MYWNSDLFQNVLCGTHNILPANAAKSSAELKTYFNNRDFIYLIYVQLPLLFRSAKIFEVCSNGIACSEFKRSRTLIHNNVYYANQSGNKLNRVYTVSI